jgi:hypothetical protein
MADLTIIQQMIVQAYGIYLDRKHNLEFSTRDKYRQKAAKHFENPDQHDRPPHLNEALEKLNDYTS